MLKALKSLLSQKYFERLFLIMSYLGRFWNGFTILICLSQGSKKKLTLLTFDGERTLVFNEQAARIMLLLLQ